MTQTAAAIAAGVRSGDLTARDVVADHLSRVEASALNAFISVDEGALERAEDIDGRRAAGEQLGALAGVPVALKDIVDHAGRVTTCGSSFYRKRSGESATVVTRLEAADAVIIGRTGLHEFAYGFTSENDWFGPVHNPWNPELSSGGSSGGSGAAVAAGLAAIGIGTDTGGSIRVPAALCGVVGLKVTHGRVSLSGVFPLAASLDTVGPLTRTVEDAALVYSVMAGYDPADPWSSRRQAPDAAPVDLETVRIGVPHPWVDHPTDPRIAADFATALEALAAAGAQIVHLDLPEFDPPGLSLPSAAFEAAEVHREWFVEQPDAYGPEVATRLATAIRIDSAQYLDALAWRSQLEHAATAALDRVDVLATPTVGTVEKPLGIDTLTVDGQAVPARMLLSQFTALVNNIGWPALAMPLPHQGAGPPSSIQIIAPRWREDLLLGIGASMENQSISEYALPRTATDL